MIITGVSFSSVVVMDVPNNRLLYDISNFVIPNHKIISLPGFTTRQGVKVKYMVIIKQLCR